MSDETVFLRQWNILRAISKEKDGFTLAEVAEKFQISTKTAKRDLKLLENVFGSFHFHNEEHGRRRYYINGLVSNLNLSLDNNELLALYIGQKLMTPLEGTCFWKGIQSVREKIKKALSEKIINYAERVAPCFYRFKYSDNRYWGKFDLINTLLNAIEQSQTVNITYQSLSSEQAKSYEIQPYNFVYFEETIYIVGYSCKDEEIRFWKTDRLESVHQTSKKFEQPDDFDIEQYMSKAIVPYINGQGPVIVQVRFKKIMARHIIEQKIKTVKKIVKEAEGSILVDMEVECNSAFICWILNFGKNAEIIGPPEVREAMTKEIREIDRLYR